MIEKLKTFFSKSSPDDSLYTFDTWMQRRPIALRLLLIKPLDFNRVNGRIDFGRAIALHIICAIAVYDFVTYVIKVTNSIRAGQFQEAQWPTTVGSSYIMCSLRGLTMLFHRKEIAKLFNDFDDIFPKDKRMQKRLKVKEYTKSFLQRSQFLHHYVSCMFLTFFAFPAGRYLIFYDGSKNEPIPDVYYPHPLWLPQVLANKPELYICFYLYSGYSLCTGVSNLLYWDHCMNCLTSQLCMHFEYISTMIGELDASQSNNRDAMGMDFQQQLLYVFRYQQHINGLANDLNSVFVVSIIVTDFIGAAVFCFALYLITTVEDRMLIILFVSAILVLIWVTYDLSNQCSHVESVSQDIQFALYNHNWYDGSRQYQKTILSWLQHTSEPFKLTKFTFAVNLPHFSEIMSMAYKMLTFLLSQRN